MAIIEAITTTYLEADTGEVVFASIPSTYEHLQLWICDRSARSSGDALQIQFGTGGGSPDSGTNYSYHNMNGTGSSAAGAATTGATWILTFRAAISILVPASTCSVFSPGWWPDGYY